MAKRDALKRYRAKRDFRKTSEPKGRRKKSRGKPIFVIQKHDALNVHYDFRLEVHGVLKSWAVPKGPSLDPGEKRLAVPTEDHPLEYADFEGVIPEDEYGAGTVMVWDSGTYRNLRKHDGRAVSMSKALRTGKVVVWLDGKKVSGGYALVRTGKKKEARWLLIKMDDEAADRRRNPVSTQPESVQSGRTMKQIQKEESTKSRKKKTK